MALHASTTNSQLTTFSSIVQQERVLSREQAIVIDSVDGKSIQQYALALSKVVPPKDILYVSRISQNRVCFYLSKSEIVETLVESKTEIQIDDLPLQIRPLTSKAKRVLISNVQPCIPNSLIVQELEKLGITPASQITTVKAGIHMPELGHLLSFRKQVYVKQEDIHKIPSSVKIIYEDVNYLIYFSTDKMMCFQCKEEGHLAKNCPSLSQSTAGNQGVSVAENNQSEMAHNNNSFHDKLSEPNESITIDKNNTAKRVHSSTSPSDDTNESISPPACEA